MGCTFNEVCIYCTLKPVSSSSLGAGGGSGSRSRRRILSLWILSSISSVSLAVTRTADGVAGETVGNDNLLLRTWPRKLLRGLHAMG